MYKNKPFKSKAKLETVLEKDIRELEEREQRERNKKIRNELFKVRQERDRSGDYNTREYWYPDYEYKPKPTRTTNPYTAKATFKVMEIPPNPHAKLRSSCIEIVFKAVDILISKHQDYGSSNIADAPGGALNGLAVRLHDKVARLANLTVNNKSPKHESVYDTFIDIINYGIIGILVLENKWDK